MKNEKGFTLVELLAVIVILGILMVIAIPAVSNYINDSRKNVYISTAKEYVKEAEKKILSKEYKFYDKDTTYYIHINNLPLENDGRSPYGEWIDAYVAVAYNGNSEWVFSWTSLDEQGFKIDLTDRNELDADAIYKVNGKDMSLDNKVSIGTRNKFVLINKDGDMLSDY
jgi:prepilin-type N-terminal cleavage/methylation domain-containing protein